MWLTAVATLISAAGICLLLLLFCLPITIVQLTAARAAFRVTVISILVFCCCTIA